MNVDGVWVEESSRGAPIPGKDTFQPRPSKDSRAPSIRIPIRQIDMCREERRVPCRPIEESDGVVPDLGEHGDYGVIRIAAQLEHQSCKPPHTEACSYF